MALLHDSSPERVECLCALEGLRKAIRDLPSNIPIGKPDGIVAQAFGMRTWDEDGPYYAINKAYEYCFQPCLDRKEKVEDNIVCGINGMDLIAKSFEFFMDAPGIRGYLSSKSLFKFLSNPFLNCKAKIWALLKRDLELRNSQISFGYTIWELFGKNLWCVKPPIEGSQSILALRINQVTDLVQKVNNLQSLKEKLNQETVSQAEAKQGLVLLQGASSRHFRSLKILPESLLDSDDSEDEMYSLAKPTKRKLADSDDESLASVQQDSNGLEVVDSDDPTVYADHALHKAKSAACKQKEKPEEDTCMGKGTSVVDAISIEDESSDGESALRGVEGRATHIPKSSIHIDHWHPAKKQSEPSGKKWCTEVQAI
ncbi:hypothetical protein BS47DRAFT_1368352 [Hydnum rufescens UP504]|uniref:Uncharacterized protein n=1 Tax=Hydnum rufescens UP504 TaxID=1448309 RepID=A0A9P6DNV9_9AGAM|nr:hypothetical protein BS47DRAFT_1368352 [Hydnum rufescens UP504]